jgi:hypothetical protein
MLMFRVPTNKIRALRILLAAALAVCLCAACSTGEPSTFVVTAATADATYWCPGGASNAPYDLHATVAVHNGTSAAVTITSVTARLTLQAVKGSWLEKVGEAYDAGAATFAPSTVDAGASAVVKVTIHSACTSATYGNRDSSYGDYRVTMQVTTSKGAYPIAAGNLHRIMAA